MRKFKTCLLVMVILIGCLAGCLAKKDEITEIRFNRGHDSMWGNQFYIAIQATEIVQAHYIPEGSSELVTVEHLSITEAQWQTIKSMVEQLPLEKVRTNIWEKQKLDGSEFRELTLVRGKKETTYYWPDTPEAQQMEQFFEALLLSECASSTHDTECIDGGVQHYVDEGSPKFIESTQIQSFYCEFSAFDLSAASSPIAGRYHTLHAVDGSGSYEARGGDEIFTEREFILDETFFDELQRIVEKYDLAQYNGQFYTVSGLPPDYGVKLKILYDSGERIRCSNNQSCFLSIEVMEELVSLFYPNDSVN